MISKKKLIRKKKVIKMSDSDIAKEEEAETLTEVKDEI